MAASMTSQAWTAVIAAAGILLSVAGAAIMVSYRVGKIEAELRTTAAAAQTATTNALNAVVERLARIEGMFELRLKDWPAGHS